MAGGRSVRSGWRGTREAWGQGQTRETQGAERLGRDLNIVHSFPLLDSSESGATQNVLLTSGMTKVSMQAASIFISTLIDGKEWKDVGGRNLN